MSEIPSADNSLWQFALAFYGRPGVAPLCLQLQADQGLAVNRVIFCLWLARQQQGVAAELFSDKALEHWHYDRLLPLRKLRYQVRDERQQDSRLDAAYEQLKQAELACEKTELHMLYDLATANDLCPALSLPADDLARANLEVYLQTVQGQWSGLLQSLLDLSSETGI